MRRPDTKAAATTRSAPGQGPLGAGRDSRGSSPRGPQRNKPRGACSSVASPSRSVAFTGRRAGESRAPSPGARRNQPQRTQKPAAAEPKETGSKGRGRNRRADRKCVVGTGNVLQGDMATVWFLFKCRARGAAAKLSPRSDEKAESFPDCGLCKRDPRFPGGPRPFCACSESAVGSWPHDVFFFAQTELCGAWGADGSVRAEVSRTHASVGRATVSCPEGRRAGGP